MKINFKNIFIGAFAAASLLSCRETYLDKIVPVAAGTDASAPSVAIATPSSISIPFTDTSTNLALDYTVSDDIEISKIVIYLDGNQLASYNSFLDYRNYAGSYTYSNLPVGTHTFKVVATDASGKTTTTSKTFVVTNVYVPFNSGETFFVSFDNPSSDPLKVAMDQIKYTLPTSNPFTTVTGITGNAVKGSDGKYINYSKPNDWYAAATSLSVSVWFKSSASQTKNSIGGNGPEYIFSTPSSNGHWSGCQTALFMEGNNSACAIKFLVVDATVSDKWVTWEGGNAIGGLMDQNWHHLAITYDKATSNFTLYIDGKANPNIVNWAGHGNINFDPNTVSSFRIGCGPQNNFTTDDWLSSSFKGSIDQFRLFTTALTSSEVSSLYSSKL